MENPTDSNNIKMDPSVRTGQVRINTDELCKANDSYPLRNIPACRIRKKENLWHRILARMYFNKGRCVRVCRAAYLWRLWSYVHLIQASGAGSTPTPSQNFQTMFGEWMSTRPEWERMCCLCYIDLVAASSVVHYNTAQVTGRVASGGRQEARRLHKGAVRLNRKCTGALNIYSTPQDSLKTCGNDPSLSL